MSKRLNYLFHVLILLASFESFSQFNFGLGVSANPHAELNYTPGNTSAKSGFGIVLEPKYQLSQKSRLGISTNFVFNTAYRNGFFSYDYRFSKKSPFYSGIGLGVGTYRVVTRGSNETDYNGAAYDFRLGLQGKVDFNIGINYIDNEDFFLVMKLALVLGYKKPDVE